MTSPRSIQAHTRFDFGPGASEYDRWYATPNGKKHDIAQKTDLFRFLGYAETGARLLDVGCGTGHWSYFFANLGYSVAAVDIAPEMAKVATSRHLSRHTAFHVADGNALPFKDASFDVAAAMAAIEFMAAPLKTLHEMARCVRKEGRILIGALSRTAPLNRQRVAEGRAPYASGHLYSPKELRALLQPFGRVRMAASEPNNGSHGQNSAEFEGNARQTNLKGPFIIAEVQR